MPATRISERVSPGAFGRGATVDVESGTISGAVICGFESLNKRKYPWKDAKLAGRVGLYEGCKVNLNHSKNGRTFQEWVGVIQNAVPGDDGRPRGTVRLFKSDPYAAKVLEAAQVCPEKFGLSHVVMAKTRRENGSDVVEDIESVESVDIVIDPATNAGLFESIERTAAVEITFGQLMESQEAKTTGEVRKHLRKWLVEMEGDPLMDAPVDAAPDAADHGTVVDGAISSVMNSACQAFIAGDIDLAELGKRITTAGKAHPKLKGEKKDDGGGDSEPAEEPKESAESVQLKAENDRLIRENIDLAAKAAGVVLDDVKRGVLARSTEPERKALLESWQKPAGEKPQSAGRKTTAAELVGKPVTESKNPAPSVIVFDATGNRLVMN